MPHQQQTHQIKTTTTSPRSGQVATPVAETRLANPTPAPSIQRAEQPNRTGLPDNLKSGIESLSGYSMDDVRVHYNSSSPAQLNAHAYAQGTDIHVAPGQERHLPHEAWHVVQQKQGRVKATRQLRSKVAINDDPGLEKEADVMGARAIQVRPQLPLLPEKRVSISSPNIQLSTVAELDGVANHINTVDDIGNDYPIFTIGGTHTGDMYQVKAARALAREDQSNILIWGVDRRDNKRSLNGAFVIASYIGGGNVYYMDRHPGRDNELHGIDLENVARHDLRNIPRKGLISEGGATSIIMHTLDVADPREKTRREGVAERAVGPINDKEQAALFQRDLIEKGHFTRGPQHIIVNFRKSGHHKGAHPELDSGTDGFRQLMAAASAAFPQARIVPMGEFTPPGFDANTQPNLINYFSWPSCRGNRNAQAGLLRYLRYNINIVGAVGMRSGVMDQLAMIGIPILSIDIDPFSRNANGEPMDTLDQGAQDKAWGWDRGMKLEKGYGRKYGRAFIRDIRDGEHLNNIGDDNEWSGAFSAEDAGRIQDAIGHFFRPPQQRNAETRHASHPLHTEHLDSSIRVLENAYEHSSANPNHRQLNEGQTRVAQRLLAVIRLRYTNIRGARNFRQRLETLLPRRE